MSVKIVGKVTLKAWKAGTVKENGEIPPDAKPVYVSTTENMVVDTGLVEIAKYIANLSPVSGNLWFALGDNNTSPTASDTGLTNERVRKEISNSKRTNQTATISTFFTTDECNFNIQEAGLFIGASATAGSGTLFSHYLESYDNSSGSVDLTFEYSIEVKRG